ncbi:MAG: hypothetical protein EOP50_10205, partial [Sphingobacteriales bacterium]
MIGFFQEYRNSKEVIARSYDLIFYSEGAHYHQYLRHLYEAFAGRPGIRVCYISSDRESLCCLEVFHVRWKTLTISGTLLDCDTRTPLAGATVTLTDSLINTKVITDANGKYSF